MAKWRCDINFKWQMLKCEWRYTQKALAKALISAATKQLYEWFSLFVRPSQPFAMFPSSYHHEIFRSYYHWQGGCLCNRPRPEVKCEGHRGQNPFNGFRTLTPVWIHIWQWNDAQSLMRHRRGALLIVKVIRQISRSHSTKKSSFFTQIGRFRTVTPVLIKRWLRNAAQSLK